MDIRLYTYEGYSVLRKINGRFYVSRSLEEAMQRIAYLRNFNNRFATRQLVLIDYTGGSRSKILHVNNPDDILD